MGKGQSSPEQERTLDINVNMFSTKFLDYSTDKTVDLICLSGKKFPVRYNLDETKPPGDRLLMYWDWLAPVFWGPPPGSKSWAILPTIVNFITQNVHLERCNVLATDTCSCSANRHTVVEPGFECQYKKHWHHFCARHVAAWLTEYVVPAIFLKESKEKFDEYIAIMHQKNPQIIEYYATGDRTDTQIMLESVRNMIDWVSVPPLSMYLVSSLYVYMFLK